ncbi:hypothetical protein FWK35_00008510 [Aphis craccivora]|uniref:Uncharacterized protein n=1 Tax=Aphis craccivora TaxID=307492 RepID=A0A6G0YMY7_APHCR|nr:hypothetical protein FWK35_00008510 [Aphis craccivora]
MPDVLYDKFKMLSDDYIFIKDKYNIIHNILNHTNLSDCLSYNK